ncbi:MAG: PKD domain-containing protein, partial [Bacteroidota bacterium]
LIVLMGVLFSFSIGAQSTLSGIINTYATLSDIDYCSSTVTLSTESADALDGYAVGDVALLLQVQGASISEERSGSFGTIVNMNNAGKYERVEIANINGNQLTFVSSVNNTYDLEAGTQLISYPNYQDATVVAPLEAKAWDGKTGGVLAFSVAGTLTLNAPIQADAKGFRGGIGEAEDNDCTGFADNAGDVYYPAGSWRGAPKGEGVAAYILNKENGRGPQANGGGGGNDHNSGGAGGSHVTIGGNGGNRETPFVTLRCKGNNPGRRGNALPEEEERLYFGGGGGAGHANNISGLNGGNGGGLIIIEVANIVGNGQRISAIGGTAQDASGDGGSGGGAGGSVVLIADGVTGELVVDVSGGNGASARSDGSDNCFGPGGGGSGGRVLTNSIALDIVATGGTAGLSLNNGNASCNNTTNDAQDGQSGRQYPISRLLQNTVPLAAPQIATAPSVISACTTQDAFIALNVSGAGLRYQWQIDRGNGFIDVVENQVYSGTTSSQIVIQGLTELMDGDMFRLVVRSDCFAEVISDPIQLDITAGTLPEASFDYVLKPNGVVEFTNTSVDGAAFLWNFNGGIASVTENAVFTYPAEGDYSVTLAVTNQCGTVSITETIKVIFQPTASFSAAAPQGCTPHIVDFVNSSTANATELEWRFEGGTPDASTVVNPSITYEQEGIFDVILIAKNEVGTDTILLEDYVQITTLPIVDFEIRKQDLTIFLENNSVNAEQYEWDFGDGNTSTDLAPRHTYSSVGNYTVTLFASNACGENAFTQEIPVSIAPRALFSASSSTGCSPFEVQFSDISEGIVNAWTWRFPGGTPSSSTDPNPLVTYSAPGNYAVELQVANELDQDTVFIEGYVRVLEPPMPSFEIVIEDQSIRLTNTSENADSYAWSFGDDSPIVSEENPVHTFARNGLYSVTLSAYNLGCGRSATQSIGIFSTGTNTEYEDYQIRIFPNPAHQSVQVDLSGVNSRNTRLVLTDVRGQVLLEQQQLGASSHALDVSSYEAGIYLLRILGEDWQLTEKLVVVK